MIRGSIETTAKADLSVIGVIRVGVYGYSTTVFGGVWPAVATEVKYFINSYCRVVYSGLNLLYTIASNQEFH